LIPTAQSEIATLSPLWPMLYEIFEAATERACRFFEADSAPINRDLFPELVRYFVSRELRDKEFILDGFVKESIIKNGLSIIYRDRRIRMWKTLDDELPPPGRSRVKQGFLGQQLSFFPASNGIIKTVKHNLAVLWNIDTNYRLDHLQLAYPESVEEMWVPAKAHWTTQIPHPVSGSVAGKPVIPEDNLELELELIESDSPSESERTE
jgi:hypothetical protein